MGKVGGFERDAEVETGALQIPHNLLWLFLDTTMVVENSWGIFCFRFHFSRPCSLPLQSFPWSHTCFLDIINDKDPGYEELNQHTDMRKIRCR